MPAEPRPEPIGAGASEDASAPQAERSSEPSDASIEASASEASAGERRATGPLVRATDPSGALKATREMPEPDSLGG
jgi:hypothetical protein